jgi:predicted AAA+ superfamily ATPase
VGKRLVKSPKTYIRDSGLLHALLNIASVSDLQGHPIVGASWEGFVVEQVAAHLPEGAQLGFYRTAAGAEMDIVVQAGRRCLCIEVKFSSAPTVSKGFWHARDDLQPAHTVVVAPVERRFPLKDGVDVVPVSAIADVLAQGL